MTRQSNDYLHSVRQHELQQALTYFPAAAGPAGPRVVVEVGAGTGAQAAALESLGYKVHAYDLATSSYRGDRLFPVVDYDGRRLPLADECADVVFSSNVLEHVPDVHGLLAETRRVMNDGAIAVHVLPTPAWRIWTLVGHYGWLAKRAAGASWTRLARSSPALAASGDRPRAHWVTSLYPGRHGERGNALSEIYLYSSRWWMRMFMEAGFDVVASKPVGLFYTGGMVLAGHLSMAARQRLAPFLGSSCRVYVLRAKRGGGAGSQAIPGQGPMRGGGR